MKIDLNKSVVSWALYDVANTVFNLGVVGLFLPLWINQRQGTTDADLGFPVAISMLIVLALSPFIGAITDQLRGRIGVLTGLNIGAATFIFFIGFPESIELGLFFFSIAFISVYLGELVYNAMLESASTPENRGKVGGIAIGLGYLGGLAVIAMALQYEGSASSYKFEFQVIAVYFMIMAIPITLFFKENNTLKHTSGRSLWESTWIQIKSTQTFLVQNPRLTKLFVARYFYMISVTTGSTFGVLYGIKTIGFTEREVELVLLVGALVSIPSAVAWGFLVDRIGPALALKWNILGWVLILAGSVSIPWLNLDNQLWWPLGAITGMCFGGLWVADRPLLIQLSPSNLGEMFGIYGTISRLAFLTGSFTWSLIAVTLDMGQTWAVFVLMCCSTIGFLILIKYQRS